MGALADREEKYKRKRMIFQTLKSLIPRLAAGQGIHAASSRVLMVTLKPRPCGLFWWRSHKTLFVEPVEVIGAKACQYVLAERRPIARICDCNVELFWRRRR
jgi:hypothetical protein